MAEAEHVRSLERGLAVLQSFSSRRPRMTMAEIAETTGLPRATARRLLHTLEKLNFVASSERGYTLTPKVLTLGYGFISSQGIGPLATPRMEGLARDIHEAVTLATLLDTSYIVIARADSDRVLTTPIVIGDTREAVNASSLGKVLLAHLPPAERLAFLARVTLTRYTERTITDRTALLEHLDEVRTQGWAMSDEELEKGLVSVGAPIFRGRDVVAALNTATHTGRVSAHTLRHEVLPRIIETARTISADLTMTAP